MRTSIFLGTALTVLCASGIASAAKTNFQATMSGAQESPAVVTTGTGQTNLTYDDTTKKLCGQITYALLVGGAVSGVHIHKAPDNNPTLNGGVWQGLTAGPSPIKVNVTLNPTQQAEIAAFIADANKNPLYTNIHTPNVNNGNGEIRGNLAVGGAEQTCDPEPDGGTDGGTDGGAEAGTDSGTDAGSSSGSSGNTSSGSTGATTTPSPDGGAKPASSSGDDDGCSSTGSSPASNGLAIGLGALIALGFVARARKRAKR